MQTDSLLFLDKWRDLASRMTGLSAKDDIFENRSTWNARPFSWIHEKTETEIHKYLLVFGWESRMARFGFSFSKPADPLRCSVLSANLALFSFIYLFSYISLYSTFFVREGGISSFLSLSLRLLFPLSLPLLFLPSFSFSLSPLSSPFFHLPPSPCRRPIYMVRNVWFFYLEKNNTNSYQHSNGLMG